LNPEPPVIIRRPADERRDGGVFDEYELGLDELEVIPSMMILRVGHSSSTRMTRMNARASI
jgi:hypothetical protein